MKKLFTLAAASVLALGAMAVTPKMGGIQAGPLSPKMEKLNQDLLKNPEVALSNMPSMKHKVWSDTKTNSVWTLDLSNPGVTLGDAFGWPNPSNPDRYDYHPSIQDMPYYIVTCLLKKTPLSNDGSTLENMSVGVIYYLLWPSYVKWQQWPDQYSGVEPADAKLNYDIVSFEDMANVHNNELFEDITYCHTFKEIDEPGYYLPWSDAEYNKDNEPLAPSPSAWQIWLMSDEQAGIINAYVNGQPATSGLKNGSSTQFTFESWDEHSEWLEMNGTLYFDPNIRLTLNYNGTGRVTGWSNSMHPMQELSEVHIFNTGVGSSEISGDMDEYGVKWGPLQKYYAFGCGKYVYLYYGQEIDEGGKHIDAISSPFDISILQPYQREEYWSANLSYDKIQNFFAGMLFSEVDYDIEKGGKWNMLAPSKIPGTNVETVKPVAQSYCGYADGYGETDGFYFVTNAYQDFPVTASQAEIQEGLTYGNFINIGTTDGMQINYFTGMGDYYGEFKGDIIYHYDPEDMLKTRTFSAVGSIEPSANEVAEIEAVETAAPVYYNLQGVRVAKPENGLFIKVAGNKTSKVIL